MVINKLMDDEIQSAIAELPQEYRAVIVLCDVVGYKYSEIAAILDVPVVTVRSRLSRGLAIPLLDFLLNPLIAQWMKISEVNDHVTNAS